jgi:hypothetical protein
VRRLNIQQVGRHFRIVLGAWRQLSSSEVPDRVTKQRASRDLYLASRTARDIEAVESGSPKRIVRRIKNRILGRFVSRLLRGLWR